jgi:hypothetical protein
VAVPGLSRQAEREHSSDDPADRRTDHQASQSRIVASAWSYPILHRRASYPAADKTAERPKRDDCRLGCCARLPRAFQRRRRHRHPVRLGIERRSPLLDRASKRERLHGGLKILSRRWRWRTQSQEYGSRWAEQQQPNAFRV